MVVGHANHLGELRGQARIRAGHVPGVLVTLPGGPRSTRVLGESGELVEEFRPRPTPDNGGRFHPPPFRDSTSGAP